MSVSRVLTVLGVCLRFDAPAVNLSGPSNGFELKLSTK